MSNHQASLSAASAERVGPAAAGERDAARGASAFAIGAAAALLYGAIGLPDVHSGPAARLVTLIEGGSTAERMAGGLYVVLGRPAYEILGDFGVKAAGAASFLSALFGGIFVGCVYLIGCRAGGGSRATGLLAALPALASPGCMTAAAGVGTETTGAALTCVGVLLCLAGRSYSAATLFCLAAYADPPSGLLALVAPVLARPRGVAEFLRAAFPPCSPSR